MAKDKIATLYSCIFPDYPDIVTVRELQKMLGISRPLAYTLINSGKIRALKLGNQYKIPKVHVISYMLGTGHPCANTKPEDILNDSRTS